MILEYQLLFGAMSCGPRIGGDDPDTWRQELAGARWSPHRRG